MALAVAVALMVLLAGAAYAVWTRTDLDADGLIVDEEWRYGTDPRYGDTDLDGLPDGWEVRRGLQPLHLDTDRDLVPDGLEIARRSNPLAADTDGDGLADAVESYDHDCNANGYSAVHEEDDDSDARVDAEEPPHQRCRPDSDEDGVLDGYERHPRCVLLSDCDTDGLDDDYEHGSRFDPLNPDTFRVGLEDAILDAFLRRGQEPSEDADRDGIPDGWEVSRGLIDWGAFTPANGTRDLLIEFIRVQGPDSGRHAGLSFEPAYETVRQVFANEAGIRLQWVETRVTLDEETFPALIPSSHADYYAHILSQAQYATNPYVTTVVMNPQHDQSEVLHAGVAPIRGMLAAVDYGTVVTMRYTRGSQSIQVSPILESAIRGNRLDLVQRFGYEAAGHFSNGDMFLDAGDYVIAWRPYWFRTAPRVITDEGDVFPFTFQSATVNQGQLAFVIAHELGHTLGLCHLDLPDCLAGISLADRPQLRTSTMHPEGQQVHFLPSEWAHVARYMACPPHGPVRLLAQNQTAADIIEEKYGYTLNEISTLGLRACGDFSALPTLFQPRPASARYDPPAENLGPPLPTHSAIASILYLVAAGLVTAGASMAAALYTLRRFRGP